MDDDLGKICEVNSSDNNTYGIWKLMVKKSDFQLSSCMLNGRIAVVPPRICGFTKDWCSSYCHQSGHYDFVQYKGKGREIERRNMKSPNLIQEGVEFEIVRVLSYPDLSLYTDKFGEENFIGTFQFGKVYHGKIESQNVTVKIWEIPTIYVVHEGDNECRLRDEIILLQNPNLMSHPNLVKLIGYCYEGDCLGIVYDLSSLDTLHNLLLKGLQPKVIRLRYDFWRNSS
ncbi:hypothetical protein L1049_025128 [Liquidambar formosana]|uniref:Protein kinase domain-containing protein n=1 Tax=Liquidambar formosana TaxID=63359 RepID=A0AAP0RWB1_LIQFO